MIGLAKLSQVEIPLREVRLEVSFRAVGGEPKGAVIKEKESGTQASRREEKSEVIEDEEDILSMNMVQEDTVPVIGKENKSLDEAVGKSIFESVTNSTMSDVAHDRVLAQSGLKDWITPRATHPPRAQPESPNTLTDLSSRLTTPKPPDEDVYRERGCDGLPGRSSLRNRRIQYQHHLSPQSGIPFHRKGRGGARSSHRGGLDKREPRKPVGGRVRRETASSGLRIKGIAAQLGL